MIKITTRQLILLANTYSIKSITRSIYIIKRGRMKYTLARLVQEDQADDRQWISEYGYAD